MPIDLLQQSFDDEEGFTVFGDGEVSIWYVCFRNVGRVGVVAITLASHARGREFEPRIRYFSIFHYLIFIIERYIYII